MSAVTNDNAVSYWVEKKRFRFCPVCMVGQEKKNSVATPFCPICGTRMTNETAEYWKMNNCGWVGDEDEN